MMQLHRTIVPSWKHVPGPIARGVCVRPMPNREVVSLCTARRAGSCHCIDSNVDIEHALHVWLSSIVDLVVKTLLTWCSIAESKKVQCRTGHRQDFRAESGVFGGAALSYHCPFTNLDYYTPQPLLLPKIWVMQCSSINLKMCDWHLPRVLEKSSGGGVAFWISRGSWILRSLPSFVTNPFCQELAHLANHKLCGKCIIWQISFSANKVSSPLGAQKKSNNKHETCRERQCESQQRDPSRN